MKVVIIHQTVANHDAIGNDIEAMYHILSEHHDCGVYAKNQFNKTLRYIGADELDKVLHDKQSLIIYHHSVFWEEGEKLLKQAECKVVIRYHNITPPEYFHPYNDFHYSQCKFGRDQTERLVEELPEVFWLAASKYNAADINVPRERLDICPPFNKIEQWARSVPDEQVLEELLYSDTVNLLFVGRVAPNKGHLFLLDALRCYCENYDSNIMLRIIGKFDESLPGYSQRVNDKIERLGLHDNVRFIGEINDSILTAYYLGSDFFVCASEHEGFCVPILESQYFQLPVIARATSAVPETIGKKQIVLGNSPKEFAAAIHLLKGNNKYIRFIRENGTANFQNRFTYKKTREIFTSYLSEKLGIDV